MPSALLPTFAEIHVVSDIHIGGRKTATSDFQIFTPGERLAGLIDRARDARPGEDVAFVLNGDVIDSLAEEDISAYVALDEKSALDMIERLWTDDSFKVVWSALHDFLAQRGRHLIVVVGNHDIELALPLVEAELRRRLAGTDPERQSRLIFSTHGAGFACTVGQARVFCTHGNEVDPMNWVDYNLLGQLANAMSAGRSVDATLWKPNGGTRLVKDVMNLIKRVYPFVDLLKPETAAIAGVLMALDRETFRKVDLSDAIPILKDAFKGRSLTSHLLGFEGQAADARSVAVNEAAVLRQVLGPNLREALADPGAAPDEEDQLLLQAGTAAAAGGVRPLPKPGQPVETLGAGDYIAGLVGFLPKVEALRRALKDWLEDDKTYDVSATTHDGDLFKAMETRVGPGVDFVITGHTHLARALRFPWGGYYYNCGTWIRLLRLTSEVLDSRQAFEAELWPVLNARSMRALDDAEIPGPGGRVKLLHDRTNAVRLSVNAQGQTVGDLLRVTGNQRNAVAVELEAGTRSAVV